MSERIKQRGSGRPRPLALLRTTQRLERALQPQTLPRCPLPGLRPERPATPYRPPQRRQCTRRLHTVDMLQPMRRQRRRSRQWQRGVVGACS